MPSFSINSGGFSFSKNSLHGTWSWEVQSNNIAGSGQQFQINHIRTPYGFLSSADIPIPGDIIQSMSDSLSQIMTQLSPIISFISGTPSSISSSVISGSPRYLVQSVYVQNSGAFGSFLTVIPSSNSPWLLVTPTCVKGLNKNDQGKFDIIVDPSTLSPGSFNGRVTFQDPNGSSSIFIDISLSVQSKPEIQVSTSVLNFSYSKSLGSNPSSQSFSVTNVGLAGSSLSFLISKVQNTSPWLSFTPPSGGPLPSTSTQSVNVSISNLAIPIPIGIYSEILSVKSSTASNSPQNIQINLSVVA
jgi:hypothetical protein